jgi:rhomboid family protein
MGIYDREYYRKEGPSFLDSITSVGRVCKWLIGLNVLVFALQLFVGDVVTRSLWLDTEAVKHGQVWRLLTYAFVHDTSYPYLHIIFNMLFLWWFGTDVEVVYGRREFLAFYLVSGTLGGVAFQVWAMVQGGPGMYCLGASGAVTAVLVLCACHFPQRIILLMMIVPVPIWLFAIIQVVQDTYRVFNSADSRVAAIVHLAGAAFAFVYYKQQIRVLGWLPSFRKIGRMGARPGMRLYRPEEDREPVPVAAMGSTSEMDEHLEAKLDAVLEKVSRHGQGSLTESERKILLRASEIYKRKRT